MRAGITRLLEPRRAPDFKEEEAQVELAVSHTGSVAVGSSLVLRRNAVHAVAFSWMCMKTMHSYRHPCITREFQGAQSPPLSTLYKGLLKTVEKYFTWTKMSRHRTDQTNLSKGATVNNLESEATAGPTVEYKPPH